MKNQGSKPEGTQQESHCGQRRPTVWRQNQWWIQPEGNGASLKITNEDLSQLSNIASFPQLTIIKNDEANWKQLSEMGLAAVTTHYW